VTCPLCGGDDLAAVGYTLPTTEAKPGLWVRERLSLVMPQVPDQQAADHPIRWPEQQVRESGRRRPLPSP